METECPCCNEMIDTYIAENVDTGIEWETEDGWIEIKCETCDAKLIVYFSLKFESIVKVYKY